MTDLQHEEHYSAHLLHSGAIHFAELDSRRDDFNREYALLSESELCLCGTKWSVAGEAAARGLRNPSGRTPSTLRLDLLVAYKALPIRWRGRTIVYLLTHETHDLAIRHKGAPCDHAYSGERLNERTGRWEVGHLVLHNESQILQMLSSPEFEARHRRRIALESFLQPERDQDAWPERESPWSYMARTLHPVCRCFPTKAAA